MREIDGNGLLLCRLQGKIFESSASLTACSSAVFLRRYMNSDVAKRLDIGSYLFESSSEVSVVEEINEQFGESRYGSVKYSENELYWMGYLYRYWCYTYEKSSKEVYRIIKPAELRLLYFPYHSLDLGAAVARILEAKNCREEDYIQRGVAILRRKMQENSTPFS